MRCWFLNTLTVVSMMLSVYRCLKFILLILYGLVCLGGGESVDFVGLTERELAVVSCLAKHIKELVNDFKCKENGWDLLLKELDEIIRLADSGLASSLISKLYISSSR